MTDLFTYITAAKALHMSDVSLRKYVKAGKISFYQVGGKVLFDQKHLDAFLATCEQATK